MTYNYSKDFIPGDLVYFKQNGFEPHFSIASLNISTFEDLIRLEKGVFYPWNLKWHELPCDYPVFYKPHRALKVLYPDYGYDCSGYKGSGVWSPCLAVVPQNSDFYEGLIVVLSSVHNFYGEGLKNAIRP